MLRLCELAGLTVADLSEIIAFVIGVIVASVFVGNIFSWILKESFEMVCELISHGFDLIEKHIRKNNG